MDWLTAFCTAIDLAAHLTQLIRGTGMDSDLIPLAAILLFAGGLIFWLFLLFAMLAGLGRAVRWTYYQVMDFFFPLKAGGGTLPHIES